jgi:hypothetical protein
MATENVKMAELHKFRQSVEQIWNAFKAGNA